MQELVGALHWYHGGIVNLKNTGTTSCRLVSPNPYFNSLCVFMYEFMDYISCFIHMNSYTCEFLFMNSYMICIHEFIFMWIHTRNDHIKLYCLAHTWIHGYLNSYMRIHVGGFWIQFISIWIKMYKFMLPFLNSWVIFHGITHDQIQHLNSLLKIKCNSIHNSEFCSENGIWFGCFEFNTHIL